MLFNISQNLQENTCPRASFLIVVKFVKIETLPLVFSCEFWEISKKPLFTEHLWVTASDYFTSKHFVWRNTSCIQKWYSYKLVLKFTKKKIKNVLYCSCFFNCLLISHWKLQPCFFGWSKVCFLSDSVYVGWKICWIILDERFG